MEMGYSCVVGFLKRKIYFSVARQDALSPEVMQMKKHIIIHVITQV